MGIATTTKTAAARQLSDQNSQGTIMGASTTDLIGFYGVATPVKQANISGSVSSGTLASSIANALVALGLVNASSVAA